jgi:hypothetical protein
MTKQCWESSEFDSDVSAENGEIRQFSCINTIFIGDLDGQFKVFISAPDILIDKSQQN